MSRHARHPLVRTTRVRLALEPLEDRLLLAAAIVGPLPAAASTPAQSAPSADTSTDADSASYGTTVTTATANNAVSGPSVPSSYAATQPSAATGSGYQQSGYPTRAYTSYASDYATAPRTTSPTVTATAASSAVLALGASTASAAAQQAVSIRGTPQLVSFVPTLLPGAAREALRPVETVTVQSTNVGPVPRGAAKEDPQSAPKFVAKAIGEENTAPDLLALEAQPGLPIMLPLSGLPLGLDLAGWERGVRAFFSRLDALGDDEGDGNALARLAPWCALAGAMAAGLELARRHLSRRQPPDLVSGAGRGLAWRWLNRSSEPEA